MNRLSHVDKHKHTYPFVNITVKICCFVNDEIHSMCILLQLNQYYVNGVSGYVFECVGSICVILLGKKPFRICNNDNSININNFSMLLCTISCNADYIYSDCFKMMLILPNSFTVSNIL